MNQTNNAMTVAVTQFSYFAPGLLQLHLVDNAEIETLRTNGVRLEVNPQFMATLNQKERVFCLLHEWYHIMLRHHLRMGNRNAKLWNYATDYVINGMLKDLDNVSLPKGCLYDKRFDGMTEEQVYALIEQDAEQQESAAQGTEIGEVEPHPDLTGDPGQDEQKIEELTQEVKQQISAGLQAAKMQGKETAELERLLGQLVEPRIDWQSELINFVQVQAKDDYSFKKPNTRMAGTGFIVPSMYSERIGKLVFVGDTSGSINEELVAEFGTNMLYAFESVPLEELNVLWVDTRVQSVERYQSGDSLELKPKGGGGTSFIPAFTWLDKEGEFEIAGLIYLTDGYCNRFADEPEYPILWAVYDNRRFQPPYGRVIYIELEK